MVTYNDSEMYDYLIEDGYTAKQIAENGIHTLATLNGFSYDNEIQRYIAL